MITEDTNPAPAPRSFWWRVVDLYADGFRSMTIGRKLWVLIIVKLIFIFGIMKLFFFPDLLSRDYNSDSERAEAVRHSMTSNPN